MSQNASTAAAKGLTAFAGVRFFVAVVAILALCRTAGAQNRGEIVRTGDMTVARFEHTATLLPNGKVLIAGGGTASAELYDPSTGSFTATGSMKESRRLHTATLLPNGKVLIAGGQGSSSAELYDPETETFAGTGNLIEDQFGHTATLLPNGKVLIAGGERAAPPWPTAARAELYDVAAGTFSIAAGYASYGSLYAAGGPIWPTANMLPDGRVLIAGENPPEIYDPIQETFALSGRMTQSVYQYGMEWHAAASLSDGTVLITGGNDDWTCGGFDNAEIYEPASGTFTAVGKMTIPRDIHSATLLRDGTVLIAGGGEGWCSGSTHDSAELYEPGSRSFVAVGKMAYSRAAHTATLLNDGTVLIAGGYSYWPWTSLRTAELYRPAASQPRRRAAGR